MGLLRILFTIVAALVLIGVGIGAYLYFTDYAAKATVTGRASDTECPAGASECTVTVTPKLVPTYHYPTHVQRQYWQVVCVGYQVEFHLQTHKLKVYDPDGRLVYDSEDPNATNVAALTKCAASNLGA